jgi:hypothetical protein
LLTDRFSEMKNNIKKYLLAFIFIILWLPAVQYTLPFLKNDGLKGYVEYAADIEFSWERWFEGTYQLQKSRYINDWTGFRADLVRLNNQVDYSVFRQIGACTLGLDNCLFFGNYIDSYEGSDFIGDDVIRGKLLKLKAISDTLGRLGKSLILVHAANKAYYYAEDIPVPWRREKIDKTNLVSCLRIGDSLGIKQINFNGWFVSMKNTTKELLLSKQGTHWTNYGAFIAGDSLVRYIEKLRAIKMPHPVISEIRHTHQPATPDADLADVVNLIFPIADETFSYPVFRYEEDSTKTKPRVIFMGDSFVINMIKNWTLQGATTDWQFWFYFKYVMNKDNNVSCPSNPLISNFDWKGELNKTDCVVILCSSQSIPILGNGFIDSAYNYYYPKN